MAENEFPAAVRVGPTARAGGRLIFWNTGIAPIADPIKRSRTVRSEIRLHSIGAK